MRCRLLVFTASLVPTLAVPPSAALAQHIVGARDARALRADSVFQRFDRSDSPGCALGVYQDGKVLYARGGVVAFGIVAYVLALHATGVFSLVEQASSFGSAGVLVSACFGLFTRFGGATAAIATMALGAISYLAASATAAETPFLLSLLGAFATYVLVAVVERRSR